MAKNKTRIPEQKMEAPETLDGHPFYGIKPDKEQKILIDAIWSKDYDIIMVNAVAGSGKTTIATAVANLLVQYGRYDNIVYIMCPYGERKQGWLPGSISEKSSVYFDGFYQALVECGVNVMTAINDESMINQKNGTGYITCITDTFLRGTNLNNTILILDESQNASVSQIKKILTRVGDNTKVIMIGHDLQCDLEDKSQSGFVKYINHFKDKKRAVVCELKTNHRGWISQWADSYIE